MQQKHFSGPARAVIVQNFAVCLSNSPSEMWPNIHLVFLSHKEQRQATADPDRETTSSSPPLILTERRHPLQTVTPRAQSILQAQWKKMKKTSSSRSTTRKSDSEPEDASAEKYQHGLVGKSHLGRHTVPSRPCGLQNIPDHINNQSTALSFLELFLNADYWRLICATKQTCEASRSSNLSLHHTTPRTLSPSLSPS